MLPFVSGHTMLQDLSIQHFKNSPLVNGQPDLAMSSAIMKLAFPAASLLRFGYLKHVLLCQKSPLSFTFFFPSALHSTQNACLYYIPSSRPCVLHKPDKGVHPCCRYVSIQSPIVLGNPCFHWPLFFWLDWAAAVSDWLLTCQNIFFNM